MVKTGIIRVEDWPFLQAMPEVFSGQWSDVHRIDGDYKAITAFSQYFTQEVESQMLIVLTHSDFELWRESNIDTSILAVQYDWVNKKAYITIAHQSRIYEFDCLGAWTEQDCLDAISSLNL